MGSSTEAAGARAPQRKRGKIRVQAIMTTAMELFTEKGYDATTMTEIAKRSTRAIGSLYRFFPSKESLADALLLQFAQQSINRLAELELRAGKISMAELAKAFVAYRTELSTQRSNALSLVDARGAYDEKRLSFREALSPPSRRIGGDERSRLPNTVGKSQNSPRPDSRWPSSWVVSGQGLGNRGATS